MSVSTSRSRKKRGRGRPPTGAVSIHLRILPIELTALDEWISKQQEMISRPEAIRRLMANALGGTGASPAPSLKAREHPSKRKASHC